MKQINLTIEVEDDFEPGYCHSCPLSYEESDYNEDDGGDYWDTCVLGHPYWECPLYGLIGDKLNG